MDCNINPEVLAAVKKMEIKDGDLLLFPSADYLEMQQLINVIKYLIGSEKRVAVVNDSDISSVNIFHEKSEKPVYKMDINTDGWPICMNDNPMDKKAIVDRLNYLESCKVELTETLIKLDEMCNRMPFYLESGMVTNGISHRVFMTLQKTMF